MSSFPGVFSFDSIPVCFFGCSKMSGVKPLEHLGFSGLLDATSKSQYRYVSEFVIGSFRIFNDEFDFSRSWSSSSYFWASERSSVVKSTGISISEIQESASAVTLFSPAMYTMSVDNWLMKSNWRSCLGEAFSGFWSKAKVNGL